MANRRNIIPGYSYHIINRGNRRQLVFLDRYDYEMFLDLAIGARHETGVEIHAYCLMPNHFHFHATSRTWDDLSNWQEKIQTPFVKRYNARHGFTGHVWQSRFKDFVVQNATYSRNLIRYIERNPVASNLVAHPLDWEWSSARVRAYEPEAEWLSRRLDSPNWLALLSEPLSDQDSSRIRRSIEKSIPLGDEAWMEEARRLFGSKPPRQTRRERSRY